VCHLAAFPFKLSAALGLGVAGGDQLFGQRDTVVVAAAIVVTRFYWVASCLSCRTTPACSPSCWSSRTSCVTEPYRRAAHTGRIHPTRLDQRALNHHATSIGIAELHRGFVPTIKLKAALICMTRPRTQRLCS
jgi:hypothetical protein